MKTYGILPMAGKGTRIQPIGFSKELYPVTYKSKHFAISEFSVRAMTKAQVDEIKLVVNPNKLDIPKYYAKYNAPLCFYFYESNSLPESCLYPILSLQDDDLCLFGLPDTLFSPNDGYIQVKKALLAGADLVLGTFKVEDGSKFDSVAIDKSGVLKGVKVKQNPPLSNWVWGIWGARVKTLRRLKGLIDKQKSSGEKLLGVGFEDLIKLSEFDLRAVKLGENYFDIGTMDAVLKVKEVIDNFEL